MNRRAIVLSLDVLWFGYWAGLLAAAGAVAGCLLNPAWDVPFAALGSPPLVLLALLALRRWLAPGKPDPAPVNWIRRAPAWIWVAAYAVLLAALAVRKHAALESHGSDLGIFVNLFWNLTHGNGWYNGMLERNFLGEHFSPLLVLIAPLYRIWPAPECLLVVQSAALAVGAWPIYRLARFRLGHGAGLVAMYAYFVYPPLLGAALHDFHEVALAVPLLGFAIWWLSQGRSGLSVLALAGAVLCKEELALTAAAFGIYLAAVRRDWKTGAALFAAGVAVFLLLVGAVLPAFRGEPLPFADRYSQFSGGIGDILAHARRDPAWLLAAFWSAPKGRYLLDLLRPLGFLPLLAPLECLPALPTLARNLLSNHEPQFEIYFHYPAPLIPFFFAAAVAGIGRFRDGMRRRMPVASRAPVARWAALGWLALAATLWGASLPRRMERFVPDVRAEAFQELKAQIPAAASVCAHNRLVPHVANRRDVCTFPVVRDAEYVLLDFGYPHFEYPVHAETHRQKFLQLLAGGEYRILAAREKFVLLRRQPGASPASSPEVLDELFFRYRRENLRKIQGKRDAYWQGPAWFFPPGRWRATATVECRGILPAGSPVVFSVHPYLGGRMGEWSLGDRTVDAVPPVEPGRLAEYSFSWEFDQPRRQMLSLRILNDPRERLRLKSLDFRPADESAARAGLLLPEISSILENAQ